MYLSLKWKAVSLVLLILLILSGFMVVVNNQHLQALTEQQQQQALKKLDSQLSGSLQQSYRHNLQLIDLLPEMNHAHDDSAHSSSRFAKVLEKNWLNLQLNWGTERITLYDENQDILWQSKSSIPSRQLNLDEAPRWSIDCNISCRQIIAAPMIDSDGSTYYIQVEVSTADLLLDFNKTSGTEIGMLAPTASEETRLYSLPGWHQSIKLMTNPEFSLSVLAQLEGKMDFEQALKSTHRVRHQERSYDITVTPAGPDNDIHFIIIMDVTEAYSIVENTQSALINTALIGIVFFCITILALIWRPIDRLKNHSKILPLLISEKFSEALTQLEKNRSQHWLKDEIDTLNTTEEDVCKQLSEMRTDIDHKARKLHNMAMFDSLTQLPNRRAFMQFIQESLERQTLTGEPFCLLFIDLDNFKRINDSLGHNAGDELLAVVAQRLKSCIRNTDVIARLGGDEFCIILEAMSCKDDYSVVAEHILKTLRHPISLNNKEFIISASIGVVSAPQDGNNSQELLQNADTAMYEAKALGRNKFLHFHPDMTRTVAARLATENELRTALKEKQFTLHYQPQVNLRSGIVFGYEALIRWQHPQRGLLYPDEFIDILEETGLIVEVGRWVAEESCRQVRNWLNKGLPLARVAINLSPRQLQEEDLTEQLTAALKRHRLDASHIELEVTESLIMEDMELTQKHLTKLRNVGFSIAIDDFGTGHSSLSHLKSLPLDILKIDRSFVMELTSNNDDQEIVSAIIAMAHKLKLQVIAEGVESAQHEEWLRENLCDYTQGYFYSRPLPADEAEQLMTRQNIRPVAIR